MEIAVILAIGAGLAVRLGHNRWWIWVISIGGLAMAITWMAIGQQHLWRNSLLISAISAGLGAVLPDLGVGLRNYLRRPRTISIIIATLAVGGMIWLANSSNVLSGNLEKRGEMVGSLILGAVGIWIIFLGPFRRRRR